MSNIFQNRFSEKDFTEYVSTFLPEFIPTDSRTEARRGFSGVKQIGESSKLDLVVFAVTPESTINARMEISKHSYALLKSHPRAHALIAYYSKEIDEWRLSLITTQVTRDSSGVKEAVSNPRRFSYALGPKAKVNTPTKYLIVKGGVDDLNGLKERFSLEVVNKDFYTEISNLFTKLTGGTHGNGRKKKVYKAMLQLPSVSEGDQRNLEFAVRLIGRVIFCWFLREKKSSLGTSLMPKELLSYEAVAVRNDYYHSVLEPIFFEILNKQIRSRREPFEKSPFSLIPYLNGGLFSPDTDDYFSYNAEKEFVYHNTVIVPDEWLKEFFAFLETYNFTIDENVSFDEELSIDPEMLGRIFENLLAEINPETGESARKSTGSYYTPREIVDYMVDESLFEYLKRSTDLSDEKLKAIISYDIEDDLSSALTGEEYSKVIDQLSRIKILDPACGSGAFPIGALQKIVFILQQVDSDGRKWFEKQVANTAPEIRRVIEREFENKNFNYIRKLGVIRENIFGVDIQPIATEISRLRCFLTLIVDQSIHEELDNRGIEPLPNLDFKFVTANTLTPLPENNEDSLFKDTERIEQLKELRSLFFSSTNSERNQLKLEFKQLQNQMLDRMIEISGSDEITRILSRWDPFSHKITPWFDSEWMFGVAGFDIVIANPPYVFGGSKGISQVEKNFFKKNYFSGSKKVNLFTIFIERGTQLMREKGFLAFITPNTLLRVTSYSNIREFLLKNTVIRKIVDLDIGVFENVTASTILLFLSKNQPTPETIVAVQKGVGGVICNTFKYQEILSNNGYVLDIFSNNTYRELTSKVANGNAKLGDLAKHIRFGVVITKNINEVISSEKKDEEWKPYLDGGDIGSYCIKYSGKYIHYKKELLHRSRTSDIFESQKIMIQRITGGDTPIKGTYDSENYYNKESLINVILKNQTVEEYKYVLALLNSRLINWFYRTKFTNNSKLTVNLSKEYLSEIPIIAAPSDVKETIINIVTNILELTKQGSDLSNFDKQKIKDWIKEIDNIVFTLYALDPTEIEIVQNSI